MTRLFTVLLLFVSALYGCQQKEQKEDNSAAALADLAKEAENTASQISSGIYAVQPGESTFKWIGKKVGGEHYGNVSLSEGSFNIENGTITDGNFAVDMTSITVEDIPTDDEDNGKLLGHLKSGDFFAVDEHGTSTFAITSVEKIEGDQGTHQIKGDLTIKGKSGPVEFPVVLTKMENGGIQVKGKFTFDRTKWDINYKSKTIFPDLADKFINDEVEVEVDLVAKAG